MHASSKARALGAVGVAAGFLVVVGTALGTQGMGLLSGPVHARGTLDPTTGNNLVINSKSGVHVKTQGSVDLVTQEITFAPGGHTGWHSHPGPVLVTVKAGSLQLFYANDEGCQGTIYQAGDSFIDRGDERVHIARASPFVTTVLWATYFVPGEAGTTPFRIDAPDPGTGC